MIGASGTSAVILPFDSGVSEPTLGASDHGALRIDLRRLLATRLLIQATSSGGKSYALRWLLEQTQALVQQIVIDPEGELVALAEDFDYLVCGADPEHAPMSADAGTRSPSQPSMEPAWRWLSTLSHGREPPPSR